MIEALEITRLIDRGALFVVNHSGGKDSQAMLIQIRQMVPAEQILVVHAELPGADWEGAREKVLETSEGLPVVFCQAAKTFDEMVEDRGMFPRPKYRQCTSDLKRGPIERTIRHLVAERKARGEFRGTWS
jgi:DNA sulfur modification protein DndC